MRRIAKGEYSLSASMKPCFLSARAGQEGLIMSSTLSLALGGRARAAGAVSRLRWPILFFANSGWVVRWRCRRRGTGSVCFAMRRSSSAKACLGLFLIRPCSRLVGWLEQFSPVCHQPASAGICGQQGNSALPDHIGRATVSCQPCDLDRYGRVVPSASRATRTSTAG